MDLDKYCCYIEDWNLKSGTKKWHSLPPLITRTCSFISVGYIVNGSYAEYVTYMQIFISYLTACCTVEAQYVDVMNLGVRTRHVVEILLMLKGLLIHVSWIIHVVAVQLLVMSLTIFFFNTNTIICTQLLHHLCLCRGELNLNIVLPMDWRTWNKNCGIKRSLSLSLYLIVLKKSTSSWGNFRNMQNHLTHLNPN